LGQFGPSISLFDNKHVAGIILRFDGSGAYGGGTYDITGPTGTTFGYPHPAVAAKAGDFVELFAVGLGPTTPAVPAGQSYTGSAPTNNPVGLTIGGKPVTLLYAGLTSAGLYQINLQVPAGLGTGEQPLVVSVGGVSAQAGLVITLQ